MKREFDIDHTALVLAPDGGKTMPRENSLANSTPR